MWKRKKKQQADVEVEETPSPKEEEQISVATEETPSPKEEEQISVATEETPSPKELQPKKHLLQKKKNRLVAR
jgi:hypothetical protein